MGPNRCLATEEKEYCRTKGKNPSQDAITENAKSSQRCEQEEQDHTPGGNCGWHFHETLSFRGLA